MNMFDLTGKRALVTGGSRGLGRGMAEALLEAGAEITIMGITDAVFETADELSALSGKKSCQFKPTFLIENN